MNASGRLNTCKSRGNREKLAFPLTTGARVRNAYRTYLLQGNSPEKFGLMPHGIVEWHEHKIKYRESLVFMTSLMVRNIPTICIDGKIEFVSRIPPKDELIAAIQRRINEKLRLMIKQKKASLFLLAKNDADDEKTVAFENNINTSSPYT